MGTQKNWILCALLISISVGAQRLESTTDDNSQEEELISNYVLPKQIFNDGKPFYVDKDPISGQLDFSSKKPAGIEPEINEVIDPKEKTAVLSSVSPNFHDFLNLPVKYSSSKFVYPLVSSSYANLKYQGNNKNYISNHKNYTTTTPTTSTPKYYTLHKGTSTKIRPTPIRVTIETSTWKPIHEAIPEKMTTKHKFVPTKRLTTTERPTTKHSDVQVIQKLSKPLSTISTSTTKRTTTEKTVPKTTTTISTTIRPSTSEITTKRISTTTTTTMKSTTEINQVPSSTSNSILLTSLKVNKTTIPPKSTTPLKITQSSTLPKTTSASTVKPTERPTLTTTSISTLDVADIYNSVGNKKDPNTMSLSDLFNALAEEESSYKPSNDGLDSQGNLMQPFSPARPAPFTLHQVTKESGSFKPSSTSTTTSTTTTERILNDISEQDSNNYVRYEVQQPNVMQMQFNSAPSMNNIVISPGQHSASFVLGSQQAVGSSNLIGSVEKEALFQNGQRIQYGTVINEDLVSAMRPEAQPINTSSDQDYYTLNNNHPDSSVLGEHQVQDLTVSNTNVRFPSDVGTSDSIKYGGIPEIVNGHAQPIALPHVQSHPVVFPPNENSWQVDNNREDTVPGSNVVFKDEPIPDRTLPQKHEVLSLNQHNHHNQVSFPQLPEDLTPPQPPEEQQRPHLTSSPPHLYNEFTRKPLLGLHRPNPERPLPNILPQFRPNAKLSNGHHSPHNKESGNIRVHQKLPYPNRSLPPPFSHRRTPIGNRYSPKVNLDPVEANRRVYRVPSPYPIDRVYIQRHPQIHSRPPHPLRFVDNFGLERNPLNAGIYNLQSTEVKSERLPAFEEEDFMVEDPPKPTMAKEPEPQQMEPVVTLQMLKSQKKPQLDLSNNNDAVQQVQKNNGQSPVYVVYPVKSSPLHMDMFDSSDIEDPIVIGQRGEQPPQPPLDRDISADYQNTPFSVVRDHPQEPILMAKNKSQQNKINFPYPLEKPDPAFAGLNDKKEIDRFDHNTNIEMSPRVVNRGSTNNDDPYKDSDIPIAIAYTPTEPSKYYHEYPSHDKYSHPNLASPVIPEIRDTQTEATISEEPDSRGQYFEKDFMAPFYPSMSLSSVTNSPNGWSVYPGTTDGSIYEKNNINRVDRINLSKEEDSTKKFDPDHFQPELQSGFKPIYPPGYKIKDSSEEEVNKSILDNIDISSTTTTTTTQNPPERKKSKLEASIESLLFGDDDDFEDDEPTEKSNLSTSS